MRITPFVALIFPALLAACASELQNPLTGGFFADSGKYEFYSCEQLLPQRTFYAKREQELKLLMEKARQVPKDPLDLGDPRGFLEIPHNGETASIGSGVVGTVKKVRKTDAPH